MKKILYLLILLPFILTGQTYNIHHVVSPEGEITFWRGTQKLWVSSITSPPIYKATYYVAPWGDDDNPGTFEEPWESWQKGFTQPDPGDTVYFRGGEYVVTAPGNPAIPYAAVYRYDDDGGLTTPKNMFNYPGETPVLNCYTADRSISVGIFLQICDNWNIRGLEIKNALQKLDGSNIPKGIHLDACNGITMENCYIHDIEGPGFVNYPGTADTVHYVNCDSFNNYDPYTGAPNSPGGQGDGFINYNGDDNSYTTYRGCRSWYNSDDGFDAYYTSGLVTYDSCWSFNIGRGDGDGNGFKIGSSSSEAGVIRQYNNCVAVGNQRIAFDANAIGGLCELFNNIAYNNVSAAFQFGGGNPDIAHVLSNNIDYNNGVASSFNSNNVRTYNSWNTPPGVTVTNADFISLDASHLARARQADGSLPVITAFHLATGSDLIDAGVDVGLPYEGAAPDLGAFESNY